MADVTETGGDDSRAWAGRLGWAFGLIAADPVEREAALVRLAEAQWAVDVARDRFNELWHLTALLGPEAQYREPALREALARYSEAQRHSLPDGLWDDRPVGTDVRRWPGLPYGLLFLEWEAHHPVEWTRHAKAWGAKEHFIRDVAVPGHDEAVRGKLTDLVETVVRRAYRCKDRAYVRVARAVDSDELRGRLQTAARSEGPWGRCHARYVLWLLDRPDVPNTRYVWRTWLAERADD